MSTEALVALLSWRHNWYRYGTGYRLRASTLTREVAEKSAEQWSRTLGVPCVAVLDGDRCGSPVYSVQAEASE